MCNSFVVDEAPCNNSLKALPPQVVAQRIDNPDYMQWDSSCEISSLFLRYIEFDVQTLAHFSTRKNLLAIFNFPLQSVASRKPEAKLEEAGPAGTGRFLTTSRSFGLRLGASPKMLSLPASQIAGQPDTLNQGAQFLDFKGPPEELFLHPHVGQQAPSEEVVLVVGVDSEWGSFHKWIHSD